MKETDNKPKNEFYVYRVTEENTTKKPEEVKEERYIISPFTGRQPNLTRNENLGYHLDPSTYDCIRPNRERTPQKSASHNDDVIYIDEESFENVDPFQKDLTAPQENFFDVDPFQKEMKEPISSRGDYVPLVHENKIVESEGFVDETQIDEVQVEVKPTIEFEKPKVSTRPIIPNKASTSLPKPDVQKVNEKRNPIPTHKPTKISKYVPPKLEFLTRSQGDGGDDLAEAERQKRIINQTLADSGIKAEVADFIFGPTVTQFMIKVFPGVNVKTILNVQDNLAMYLEAESIRIQTPVPGKPYAGIEVPKKKEFRHIVHLGDILVSKEYKNNTCKLPIVVGKDNYGLPLICDITEMPHCLVAGTTKSGKSVCLNTIIVSLLYRFAPKDLRLVLMDPKRIELSRYDEIPHLAMPIITDKNDFPQAITWVYEEMERRYEEFAHLGAEDFGEYNKLLQENKQPKAPYIVTIIDEFGDWFQGVDQDVEEKIQKIAAKARAAGIHVILATQRPTTESISGDIKANFDTRIAFKVTNYVDSKVILDKGGAEKLEGHGDMLIKYAGRTEKRLQGCFVSNQDIRNIVKYLRENNTCDYIVTLEELKQSSAARQLANNSNRTTGLDDPKFAEIAYYIVRNKNASNNALTKEFGMGFNRVNEILVSLEELGVLSPAVKGKQREVLVNEMELEQILTNEGIF